jgi:hypothetical protein
MATTDRLDLPLASLGADADIEETVNLALERLDAVAAGQDRGPIADRPPAVTDLRGWRYVATDQGNGTEYVCTGDAWLRLAADPPQVTALPTTGLFTGLTVDFVPVPSDRTIVWRVRYDGSQQKSRRWVVVGSATPVGGKTVGGPDWGSSDWGGFSAPAAVPVAGRYEYEAGARFSTNASGVLAVVAPGVPLDDRHAIQYLTAPGSAVGHGRFDPQDFQAGAAATFAHRCGANGQVVGTRDYWIRYHPRALADIS